MKANMKSISCVTLLLAAAACGGAIAAEVPDMPPPGPLMEMHGHPGHGMGPMGRHMANLSDAQDDKIFAIMHAQEPQRREQERAARKAHEALRAMVDAGQFDEAKAGALAQAEGRAVATLALLQARTDAQVQAVLTPEQRQQMHDMHPQRGPRQESKPESH